MTILATTNTINGLIRVKGSDAGKFLQGQLSCDIDELSTAKSLPGAYCSPQGRIRANFIILLIDTDDYLLILPATQISFMIEAMAPYVAFFQCNMTDDSTNWNCFGLQDDNQSQAIALDKLPELSQSIWSNSSSTSISCIRLPGNIPRWLCLSQQPIDDLLTTVAKVSDSDWQQQDLISGFVWINELTRDVFLPHDISLPAIGAVSFTKGCYTGQEIVARMQYRGEPKYLLAILKTASTEAGISGKLYQLKEDSTQQKIGQVIDKIQLDDNSWIIAASVNRTLINQQQFSLSSGTGSILCSITIPETNKESDNS